MYRSTMYRYSQRQVNVYISIESLCASHIDVTVAVAFDVLVALTPAMPDATRACSS